jgi:hypothetical protein
MEKRKYFGFKDWADVIENFECPPTPEPEYVYALYVLPSYEGDATVVFKDDAGWHLVSGSHCSCYGLEGMWQIEEFDPAVFFKGKQEGRTILTIEDYEKDNPEATQENFEAWLASAVAA